MKIRPLHDRIVIKRKTEEERTAGGLFIPDSAKERPTQATVVAVGKGRLQPDGSLHPLAVKAGDTVLFGKYAGTEIKLDSDELLIIREEDVLAIVSE
jgi:chaperonin GroES